MTIQELAKQMSDNFEYAKRDDGSEFYKCKETIEWQRDIIHKAHDDGDILPNDWYYEVINDTVVVLAEYAKDEMDEDDLRELVEEVQADIYHSDLIKWLQSVPCAEWYVNEVLGTDIRNIFPLLQIAQLDQKREIARAVLEGLKEHLEKIEDEEVDFIIEKCRQEEGGEQND